MKRISETPTEPVRHRSRSQSFTIEAVGKEHGSEGIHSRVGVVVIGAFVLAVVFIAVLGGAGIQGAYSQPKHRGGGTAPEGDRLTQTSQYQNSTIETEKGDEASGEDTVRQERPEIGQKRSGGEKTNMGIPGGFTDMDVSSNDEGLVGAAQAVEHKVCVCLCMCVFRLCIIMMFVVHRMWVYRVAYVIYAYVHSGIQYTRIVQRMVVYATVCTVGNRIAQKTSQGSIAQG